MPFLAPSWPPVFACWARRWFCRRGCKHLSSAGCLSPRTGGSGVRRRSWSPAARGLGQNARRWGQDARRRGLISPLVASTWDTTLINYLKRIFNWYMYFTCIMFWVWCYLLRSFLMSSSSFRSCWTACSCSFARLWSFRASSSACCFLRRVIAFSCSRCKHRFDTFSKEKWQEIEIHKCVKMYILFN